jgi:2-polyprenyl-6-methoxyphenol hydroxylase-like FAD-dependent oxidoreductase
MESRNVDIAIVGGGVAGASVAAALATAGFGVAVIEREPRFRDRVRGESIHPWGAREADRLGLLSVLRAAGANDLPLWQTYADRAPLEPYRWADDTPDGLGELAVFHPTMQQALLDHAQAVGTLLLRPAHVTAFRGGGQPEIDVATEEGPLTVRARLVVGADGRTSAARRWVGTETRSDPVHHAVGGCLLDQVDFDSRRTHLARPPGRMALVFPQGGGRARAYLVCSSERAAETRSDDAPGFIAALADLFPDGSFARAVAIGPAAFFPNAEIWADRVAGETVVLVGDAAGANDPSLDQGLSLCFRDARELRDLLLSERDWRRAIRAFAERRATYYGVLCQHARWHAVLAIEEGRDADARRERVARAREADPSAGGFAGIFAFGPDGLVADETARRRFFGEE